jgi:hypothetical protein
MPLSDFSGLDECISDVGGEIAAADGEPPRLELLRDGLRFAIMGA